LDRPNTRTDTHSGHIINKSRTVFHIEKNIPVNVFNPAYPIEPQSFGQALRKARIDAGLQIKELANDIGVDEMTVIN